MTPGSSWRGGSATWLHPLERNQTRACASKASSRDCEPLFEGADVMLAPYYYGAGTKIKVLEALAHGLPVVTTTHGLSNSWLEPNRDVLVADEAAEFASAVVELVQSPERRRELSRTGIDYIRRHHNARTAYEPFREALGALLQRPRRASTHPVQRVGVLMEALKHLVPWTVERCLDAGTTRVALYGAGAHTRLLVPLGGGRRPSDRDRDRVGSESRT